MKTIKDYDNEYLVQAWGLACDSHNELYELLEEGYLSPLHREEREEDIDHISERIESLEQELMTRGMMDENHNLKQEFEKFLSQGRKN